MIFKLIWCLRAIFYKAFLGSLSMPSYIGKPVYMSHYKRIYIGKRVRIYPGARIEVFDKSASIHINDNISVGQNIHMVSGGEGQLEVGAGTTISANVFISNIEHRYDVIGQHIMEQPIKSLKTKIGNNCFIGYGAVIQAGTVLGEQCIVGSNAVVRGTFPDHCVIVGIPAKIVKRYNSTSGNWGRTNANGTFVNE